MARRWVLFEDEESFKKIKNPDRYAIVTYETIRALKIPHINRGSDGWAIINKIYLDKKIKEAKKKGFKCGC